MAGDPAAERQMIQALAILEATEDTLARVRAHLANAQMLALHDETDDILAICAPLRAMRTGEPRQGPALACVPNG